MKAGTPELKNRIVGYLQEVGSRGATRSELLQRFQLRTATLDLYLGPLLAERRIKQRLDERKRALGRPAMRFYAAEVELQLTAVAKPDTIPIAPLGAPVLSARKSICQVCGVAIPLPDMGRPYVYCSDDCRRAAHDGGATLRDFLSRTTEPRALARAALCLVAADLTIRGFQVAGDMFNAVTRLIVHDGENLAFLEVVVLPDSGYFPPPDQYPSVAFVYRDGRVVYTGRQPLVADEKAAPAEPAPTATETAVEPAGKGT